MFVHIFYWWILKKLKKYKQVNLKKVKSIKKITCAFSFKSKTLIVYFYQDSLGLTILWFIPGWEK